MGTNGLWYVFGYLVTWGLTFVDAYTSYQGMQGLCKGNDVVAQVMPWLGAGLALAVNACAGAFMDMFKKRQDSQFNLIVFLFVFAVVIIFDIASSFAGIMISSTGGVGFEEAFRIAQPIDYLKASVMAVLVCLGPMLNAMFAKLMAENGGFFGCLMGVFGMSTK